MSDVSKTNEALINEAREFLASENAQYYDSSLVSSLADALEVATRVPVQGEGYTVEIDDQHFTQAQWEAVQRYCGGSQAVQGEPNDDREALAKLVQRFEECDNPDYLLTDFLLSQGVGFSRATVPDAATEGRLTQAELEDIAETHAFCADRLFIETELVDEIRAERDAAVAAVERVRGVLSEWESRQERNREILGSGALGHFQAIDCTGDLRAALDGAPEPEEKP